MEYASQKLRQVKASASLVAGQKARAMQAAGIDVLSLSAGEPDFPTPPHIAQAGIQAILGGDTRYTDQTGTVALRKAVIAKFKRENNIDYTMEHIFCAPGAKNLIGTAFSSTLNPGEEVIIPVPAWVSYVDMTKLAGGTPVIVETKPEDGLKLTVQALGAAITPKTRWLAINSPCNPTGAIYSRDELVALGEVLERHPQVLVMTDEIYEHLTFDGVEFVSFLDAVPSLKERVLTVNGASKAYSMTGWRVAYAGGPAALIKAMSKVAGQMVGSMSSISQAAAVAALEGPQDYLVDRATEYQQRRDRVLELLGAVQELRIHRPQGAFYLYVDCAALIGKRTASGKVLESDVEISEWLLEDALVATVAGSAYGLSPYFRMSIATSMGVLEEACARIAEAVAGLREEAAA